MSSVSVYCGVDIGASATKLVMIDENEHCLARVVRHSGVDYAETARRCLEGALEECGATRDQLRYTVSTGYGRDNVPFSDHRHTEIHCHGVGCHHLVGRAITVIDIGGQDNKIIHIDERGQRQDFKMNRKCAAGTGAFVEEIALRLGVSVDELDGLAASTEHAATLGSFCTVFSKTEILAHLRQGVAVEAIVRGAFESVVKRILEMDTLQGDVVLTGGVVAHNPTIARILERRLGRPVIVPDHPQFTGALGAAILARRANVSSEESHA